VFPSEVGIGRTTHYRLDRKKIRKPGLVPAISSIFPVAVHSVSAANCSSHDKLERGIDIPSVSWVRITTVSGVGIRGKQHGTAKMKVSFFTVYSCDHYGLSFFHR
jgi:hypothetical protein